MRWWVLGLAVAVVGAFLLVRHHTSGDAPARGRDTERPEIADPPLGPLLVPAARRTEQGSQPANPETPVPDEETEEVVAGDPQVQDGDGDERRRVEARALMERHRDRIFLEKGDTEEDGPGGWIGAGSTDLGSRMDAVGHALRWLAVHQTLDGRFTTAEAPRWCAPRKASDGNPEAADRPEHTVGTTALALCAFLGAGWSHHHDQEFPNTVRRGLRYLLLHQDEEGRIRIGNDGRWAWGHACATLALVEAFSLTRSPQLLKPAQQGLAILERLRDPSAVWRYGLRDDLADFSLTLWTMLPLTSARLVNEEDVRKERPPSFRLDPAARNAARTWLQSAAVDPANLAGGGSTGPALPAASPAAMAAFAAAVLTLDGVRPKEDAKLAASIAAIVAAAPPKDAPAASDVFQRWAGTVATFQAGGEPWRTWERTLLDVVVARQHSEGDYCGLKGSWEPAGAWSEEGGRVVATALLCMSLEMVYRYDRAFGVR